MNFALIAIVAFVFVFLTIVLFLATRYVRCPGNKVLVIQGKVGAGRAVKCMHGGAAFIWPLIQQADFLELTPLTINIPLKGALSLQNIRVNVPSTFTIAVDTDVTVMNNAAVRLLQLDTSEVELMANEIIFGQLRLTIASLTIEEINQDRERFYSSIRNNIDPELKKIGLTLINVNITDITDESDYIESIGRKAAATALNQAKIDVAEQDKLGDVGKAEADMQRRIQVATYNATAVEGENTSQAEIAKYDADLAEKAATANQRGEVARQQAQAQIEIERALAEEKRLLAAEVVPREIDKKKIEIDAEAEAQKLRKEAAGEADAILSVQAATAEGIQKVLDAKAEGYQGLVEACGKKAKDAATMLMVEKIEEVVGLQTEAIKNLKIDKVTVWDGGNGEKGSATANFASSLIKSLPPLHDVAGMAGVELPSYLGGVTEDSEPSPEVVK